MVCRSHFAIFCLVFFVFRAMLRILGVPTSFSGEKGRAEAALSIAALPFCWLSFAMFCHRQSQSSAISPLPSGNLLHSY